MMLGRIIGTMLQCVKKNRNFFVTFCSFNFPLLFNVLHIDSLPFFLCCDAA